MNAIGEGPLLVGYDGSPSAANAIETGARLLPGREGRIVHLWAPPYLQQDLRRRLWPPSGDLDEMAALVEHEGQAEAERLARQGVALADAAGWKTEPLLQRSYGGQGFDLARLSRERGAAAVVVGSRGLGGTQALMGSTSDSIVHYSPVPVVVVPYPLLDRERQAALDGPIVVGSDGSQGAEAALAAARALFPSRTVEVAEVAAEAEESPAGGSADPGPEAHVTLRPEGVIQSARAVADAIGAHAASRGAGAIVVGSRGRSAVKEVLLGSVAMAVLHHAHRPVVVVPRAN